MVNTLFILLTTLTAFSKQVAFNVRTRRVDRIVATIKGPLFAPSHTYHEDVMRINALSMLRLLKLYHYAIFLCGTLWTIYPIANKALGENVQLTGYFPFDTHKTPVFLLTVAYMSILITVQAYGNVTMDCTIVAFYAQAKTQLQILRFNLQNLANCDDCVGEEDYGKRFVKEVESTFGEAMIVQFFVMAWVICMTVYKIVGLSIFSAEFFSIGMYLGCMLGQLFIYCYYGTQLKHESEFVNQSIYGAEWTSLSPAMRRQLLVMMAPCSRPISPCIAFVIPMSMETYIAILKSSYTLFTFLDHK